MDPFRFVICVDVDADSLKKAYKKLYKLMGEATDNSDIDWESTDEAYDKEGLVGPDDVQTARMKVFAEMLPLEVG